MSFREIKPTKTNLINLKKQLNFSIKGESFLEFKREQIIHRIKKTWSVYNSLRNDFLNSYRKSLLKLNKTYSKMAKKDVNLIRILSTIQYQPTLSVNYKKDIGILVPKLLYQFQEKKLPAYSFENTTGDLDYLIIKLKIFFETLVQFAEKEELMLKLAHNYKKINRRINGLKNTIIPGIQLDIKKIKEILEENERESYVRLKKTKELINKKQTVL